MMADVKMIASHDDFYYALQRFILFLSSFKQDILYRGD